MELSGKIELRDAGLLRAAEQIGDITAPAMELFYSRYPDALESFEIHGLGNRRQLEGMMVENTLFCLMYWFESRLEVEILLANSVPHHEGTLAVYGEWYAGLVDAVVDVVTAATPADESAAHAVWDELRAALRSFIERSVPQRLCA